MKHCVKVALLLLALAFGASSISVSQANKKSLFLAETESQGFFKKLLSFVSAVGCATSSFCRNMNGYLA